MISKDQTIIKKNPKRNFSMNEKYKYYLQWKSSGLNKSQFCQKQNLPLSVFSKWCQKFVANNNFQSQQEWLPLISENNNLETRKESMLIEFKIPHSTKLYVFFFIFIIISFLKEIIHAITVIR